jgi:hypothetical protein
MSVRTDDTRAHPDCDGDGARAGGPDDDIDEHTSDDLNDDIKDEIDDGPGHGSPPPSLRAPILSWLIALAGLTVCITFVLALGAGRASPELFVVVVTDPTPRAEPTPVLAMVVGASSVVPFSGRINGAAIDTPPEARVDADVAILEVATHDGIVIEGEAQLGGAAVPVSLQISSAELRAQGPLRQTIAPLKTPTLAVPSLGKTVLPVDGVVPARGPAEVVLVDDGSLEVLTVDASHDGRLPDGRLLAVDRRPVAAQLTSDNEMVTLVVTARRDSVVLLTLSVAGRLVRIRHAHVTTGEALAIAEPSSDFRVGDVVVATVSTAAVPGLTAEHELQLVERVGGLREADLVTIEPRAAAHLHDPRVRRALTRRLVVNDGAPRPVSPSYPAQRARQLEAASRQAETAQHRFRIAAAALLVALCGLGLVWRVRMFSLVAAAVVVSAVVWGLDQLLLATRA